MQLHRDEGKIHAAGADLYIIGNGTPNFIAGFRDQTKYDGPIYTDPSLEVYKAAQLKRGITKTFNPLALGATIKAFAHGSRQGLTQGDTWQQGGTLVVEPGGNVRWHQASDHPGDVSTADQIVAALKA